MEKKGKYTKYVKYTINDGKATVSGCYVDESAFYNRDDVITVEVDGEVKRIGAYAFRKCKNLTEVILNAPTTSIYSDAFSGCDNLQRVYIPSSVNWIAENVFADCPKLEIFCEGEVGEYWVDKEVTRYSTVYSAEDDAFNFHRSSGSWSGHTVEEKVRECWNPDNRPVHTNVTREQFDKLSKK